MGQLSDTKGMSLAVHQSAKKWRLVCGHSFHPLPRRRFQRTNTTVKNKDFSSAPAPHVAAGAQGKPPAPGFTHAVADVCKCTKD